MGVCEQLAAIRAFNRTVTERAGVLDHEYLARGRSLGASRLLWEIGFDGADVRELRSRLGLDPGYVSRLLRGLETEGLVEVGPGSPDQRRRLVRLTVAGRCEVAELDRLSDEVAAAMI